MVNCDNSSNGPNKYWKLIAKNNNFIPLDLPNKEIEKALKKKEKFFLVILVISIIMVMKYLVRLYLNN